jgi:hypothetical protein
MEPRHYLVVMAHGNASDGADDTLVWRSDPAGRRDRMLSQLYMIPVIAGSIALCAFGLARWIGPDWAAWVAGGSVFAAVAAYQLLADRHRRRRGVVEIQLSPADRPTAVTLSYADGRVSTHPLRELDRVTVSRDEIVKPYLTIELHLNGRTVRTRAGADHTPTRLIHTLIAAGVEVRTFDTKDY